MKGDTRIGTPGTLCGRVSVFGVVSCSVVCVIVLCVFRCFRVHVGVSVCL